MENIKTEPLDGKEEGEISLDDVSSSEETHYGNGNRSSRKTGIGKIRVKREIDILSQDADQGKENRRYSNELIGPGFKPTAATLQVKNDDLLPISSDEEIEFVGLPGTSKQLAIPTGPKKRRKKKKKKKSGQRMLVIDDLVSTFDDDLDIVGVDPDDRHDFIPPRPYENNNERSPSPIPRMNVLPRNNGWHQPSLPTKHYHSPIKHDRSPIYRSPSPHRRSPRQFLSPRKSPAHMHDRRVSNKSRDLSPGRYKDTYTSSLLKKVRQWDNVGATTVNQQKNKETSLKDKLSNMMIKNLPETKELTNNWPSEVSDSNSITQGDDEEDLEFLRRKALETKQPRNNTNANEINETTNFVPNVRSNLNNSDDDEEDLHLRMIALRSAVMKKHNDRIQRGVMRKKSDTIKDESPFSDGFLESLDEYLHEDSNGADVNDSQRINPSTVEFPNAENVHVEDMDIDSDVEREKENSQPYSPSEELSQQTLIEPEPPDELLQSSIELFPALDTEPDSMNITIPQYSDNFIPYSNNNVVDTAIPYSPTDLTSTPINEELSRQEPTVATRDPRLRRLMQPNVETPNSSSNTTEFNSMLPVDSSNVPYARVSPNTTNVNSRFLYSGNLIEVQLANNQQNQLNCIPSPLQQQNLSSLDTNVTNQLNEIQKTSTEETRTPIDKIQSDVTYNDILRDLAEYTGEPLYLQGVPDITKDVNKIPTLVNRTLVPRPILKTNKQLQQPLPIKKPDVNSEPTFKSAEMLPVNIQSQPISSSTVFKPIKLQPVVKKTQATITPAAVFNSSLNNETNSVLDNENVIRTNKNPDNANDNKSSNNNTNSHGTDKSQSLEVPANEQKTKVRRPRTPRNKSESTKKTQPKPGENRKSMIVSNEKVNNKITIKSNSKTPVGDKNSVQKNNKVARTEKSDGKELKKTDNAKKSDPKKGNRIKNTSQLDDKSNENSKNNSNLKKNSDSLSKQKKDTVKKLQKTRTTKSLEPKAKKTNVTNENIDKSMTTKADNKKRRSSIDEDEEALRAALLASLPKRVKTSDSKSTSTAKSTNESVPLMKKKSNESKELSSDKQQSETVAMPSPTAVPLRSVKQKSLGQNKANSNTTRGVVSAKKRASTTNIENSSKKIAKQSNVSTADAIKMMNAAEKILDAEIQKKLTLQQAAISLLSNKVHQSSKTNLLRSNVKDSTQQTVPKISASKNMEKMIIRLGEDSDSDSEADIASTKAKTMKANVGHMKETNKAPTIPTTDFERSVEEFLRAQRERQESLTTTMNTAAKPSTTTLTKKAITLTNTPLAVRHLPASKQEEYRRLKQCIAEREQQKINRNAQTTTKNHTPTTTTNEEVSTLIAPTSTVVTNEVTSDVDVQLQTKNVIPSSAKNQQTTSDPPYQGIQIQTKIGEAALEFLQTKIGTDVAEDNNPNTASPLLPDIPIKSEPLLLEMTRNITDDKQNVYVTISNNLVNEDLAELNLTSPMQPMENLTIRFPNTSNESVPFVRHISVGGNDNVSNEQALDSQTPPQGLRILTTDQLNMKYEPTETDVNKEAPLVENREVVLNENAKISENDPIVSHSTVNNMNDNLFDSSITIETYKIETDCNNIESSGSNYQTVIDANATTAISPRHNNCLASDLKNTGLDATIKLNSPIDLDSTVATNAINNSTTNMPTNIQNKLSNDVMANADTKVLVKDQVQKLPQTIDSEVQTELETVYNLPDKQQHIQLTTWEKDLVAKRYVVVHDLTKMAEDLREWEIQNDLFAEVKRLRIQLQEAEKRLEAQRAKITDMSPLVEQTHNTVNKRRNECTKLTKLCQGIGSKVIGPSYKIPSTGDQLLKERIREVSNITKQLSKKKDPSNDINEKQNNTTMITQLISDNVFNENPVLNSQSINPNVKENEVLTTVKVEKDNSSEITTANISCSSNNETLTVIPVLENVCRKQEITETLSVPNASSFNSEIIINTDNVDLSTTSNSHWYQIDDEKPPIQPAVSYESVLMPSSTPRFGGLNNLADENTLSLVGHFSDIGFL